MVNELQKPRKLGTIIKPSEQKSKLWIRRIKNCMSVDPTYDNYPGLLRSRGKGIYFKDSEGNNYLSFNAQSHNIGYNHPEIVSTIKNYIENGEDFKVKVMLAEKIKELAPRELANGKVSFGCSGTSATEKALKMIKLYSGKTVIMVCLGGYHGGSMETLSLTIGRSELRKGLNPPPSGVAYVPYPYCYRCYFGREYPLCDFECLKAIRYAFDAIVHPSDTAAFLIEPIQAHGGITIPPPEYFKILKEILNEYDVFLVSDEVVTGFGRTGKNFGIDNWSIEPDVMFMGKPIADGLPLGAVIANEELMKSSRLYSSVDGHSLACAVALANIEVIQREKLIENSVKMGEYILKRLNETKEKYDIIGDVRGKGLILGIEFVKDRDSKKPASKEAKKILEKAYHKGLLMMIGGTYHQVFRITPPLNITIEQADEGVNILDEAIGEVIN